MKKKIVFILLFLCVVLGSTVVGLADGDPPNGGNPPDGGSDPAPPIPTPPPVISVL